MEEKELWALFTQQHPEYNTVPYEAWSYGAAPDKLAELTVKGTKTATASGYDLYKLENEPIPKEGDMSIILDGSGNAVCIIKTTKVYVVPYNEVSETHAFKEGEGDRTLAYWKEVHWEFFSDEYAKQNVPFDEHSLVVCEEFDVVFTP